MNKAQEIQILRECALALGNDSYCGPWLRQVLAELENLIRSDFLPEINLEQTAIRCGNMLSEAALKSERIISEANATAKRKEQHVDSQVAAIILDARRKLAFADASLAKF